MKELKAKDIVKIMEEIAPVNSAEDWDSPGLKTGSPDANITKVIVCLDVTVDVVEEAKEKGCNMIISHHPFIFKSISDMIEENVPAVCAAVREGITVFSAHTNLDYAPDGINDSLAEAAGVQKVLRDTDGKHSYGKIEKPMTVRKYCEVLKERLNTPVVNVVIPKGCTLDDVISTVGVSCGAFDGKTYWFEPCGIDVLVTGEIKHFDSIFLSNQKIITIGAGHYYTEYPGVKKLAKLLKNKDIPCEVSEKNINLYTVI
ncbi:MAG: Nif3-like dinuclear metal center hexameric protein [Ruminococcaceae bacterium]|nr:Nif3-like dinuclear metal center hexameric protein [Oscillospiraceae bacterium]